MGAYERKQIDSIIHEMLDFTGARTAELAQNITISLAEETPKDTGLAQAAWIPSRAPGTPGRVPARNPAGVSRTERAQESGRDCVDGLSSRTWAQIFVGNPVRYIEDLAEGSSPQAKSGYVAADVANQGSWPIIIAKNE